MNKILLLLIIILISSSAFSEVLFDNCENQTQSEALWVPSDTSKIHNIDVGGNAHSGDRVWKADTPYEFYLTTADTFNILTEANPRLSFWLKGVAGGGVYYVYPQVSTDGGQNWVQLSSADGTVSNWTRYQYDLTNYKSNQFMLRLYFTYDNGYSCYLDDILIDNAPTPKVVAMTGATNNGMTISWGTSSTEDFRHYKVQIGTHIHQVNHYRNDLSDDYHSVIATRTETWVKTITNKNQTSLTFHRDSSNYLTFANTTYYETSEKLKTYKNVKITNKFR